MDELYAFLFAGLMIIFLLFAFFGGPSVDLNYGSHSGTDKDYTSNNITWKEIPLGDIISKERTMQTTDLIEDNLSVQSGFFFGSREYSRKVEIDPYVANNLNYATLNFRIEDTNNYGLLNVSIDNKTVFMENPLRGTYSVNLSKMNKASVIYIKTESSGWRVWAPSMYDISNMSLDTSYTTKETPQYEFDVPHYVYSTFYKGEIKFDSIYPIDLKVFLNGDPVFSKANTFGKATITLSKNDLVPEKNIIEFESVKDFRLENAKIYLYYRD
jgi:hypothetical protein